MDHPQDKRKMFFNATPTVFKKASWLRHHETEAEKKLWLMLKNSQLRGLRFKRQHPVGPYISDFYCHKASLVIEIDGDSHSRREQKLHDEVRTNEFEALGLKVIRFSNEEVLTNIDEVVQRIVSCIPECL